MVGSNLNMNALYSNTSYSESCKIKKKKLLYENPFSSTFCFAYRKVLVICLYINSGCTPAILSSLCKCLNSENSNKYKGETCTNTGTS